MSEITAAANTKAPPKKRIEYLDIAKGLGIFLVVWAHAKAPFQDYIYQFHMPFFVLISGLLYNSKDSVKDYIIKKIKSLYIPFVAWNLLGFLVTAIQGSYQIGDFIKRCFEIILTLSKDGQFFGATWFLGSLFVISVLYKIIDTAVPKSEYKQLIMLGLFIVIGIIGFDINFRYMLSRTLILAMFFAVGVFIKDNKAELSKCSSFSMALICLMFFIVIGRYNSANMGGNEYKYPLLFVVGAFMMSYALLYFCRAMEKKSNVIIRKINKMFMYLGKRSMDILIWQFVFFRVGIIAQMLLNHEKITVANVLSYYPLYSEQNGWWIIYTVIGLVLPLLWGSLLRSGPWGRLFKKIHIV
ncbi:MAG: acyltransferase family protein [Oscillospiraceae bacterium]